MKKVLIACLTLSLAVFTFASCASGSAEAAKVYGKDNTKITAKAGETFTIQLEENVTTGYRWSLTIADESVVKLTKDDYNTEQTDKKLVGAGGIRELTFEALKAGSTTLSLVYERSFDKHPDDQKITFNVTVE